MAGQNNGKQGGQQQDVNQLLKVRREKLANLQAKQIMRREEASWMPIRSTYPSQDV